MHPDTFPVAGRGCTELSMRGIAQQPQVAGADHHERI
jgi:hypothetical protein